MREAVLGETEVACELDGNGFATEYAILMLLDLVARKVGFCACD